MPFTSTIQDNPWVLGISLARIFRTKKKHYRKADDDQIPIQQKKRQKKKLINFMRNALDEQRRLRQNESYSIKVGTGGNDERTINMREWWFK